MCDILEWLDANIAHGLLSFFPFAENLLCQVLGTIYDVIGCTGGYW